LIRGLSALLHCTHVRKSHCGFQSVVLLPGRLRVGWLHSHYRAARQEQA
jgi:hypothetical protein